MNLYLTGEAARRAGTCPDTVRTYCKEKRVKPIRDSSGRRLFTDEDIEIIKRVYQDKMSRRPGALALTAPPITDMVLA